jgi:hypothetical protein
MNTYLKSGFAAAVVGLGIFATGGSAYAAGCLTPDQTSISVAEDSDNIQDAATVADSKGFRCDVVASEYSVKPVQTKATPKVQILHPASAQESGMPSVLDD